MNGVASAGVFRRGAGHFVVRQGEALLISFFILAVLVCVTGLLSGGALHLALTSVATLIATWIVFRAGSKILPTSICFRIVVCVYGSQSLAQLLLALPGATTCHVGGWGVDVGGVCHILALGWLSLLAGTLRAAVAWGATTKRRHPQPPNQTQRRAPQARFVLVRALLLNISQP